MIEQEALQVLPADEGPDDPVDPADFHLPAVSRRVPDRSIDQGAHLVRRDPVIGPDDGHPITAYWAVGVSSYFSSIASRISCCFGGILGLVELDGVP